MKFKPGTTMDAGVTVHPVFKGSRDIQRFAPYALPERLGDIGEVIWLYGRDGEGHRLTVGLGEANRFHIDIIREAAGLAGRVVGKERLQTVQVSWEGVSELLPPTVSLSAILAAWVEGWMLGTYAFDKYKSAKTTPSAKIVHLGMDERPELYRAIEEGEIHAGGTMLARDLSNEPANFLRPLMLADRVVHHFAGTDADVKIYQGQELERMKMAGLVAVGKGSVHPPAMIEMRFCSDPAKPLTALIGKGITFDTGGINLKRLADISPLKYDMSGASAVVGAMDIIVRQRLPVNVVALIAAAENVPDAACMLPGDVISYPNGLSVQVRNTDAEGRLVLADALLYAQRLGADEMIDIATLTGNCRTALGKAMAGIWGDDSLLDTLRKAGRSGGEKVWPMPLETEYEKYLQSDYADLANAGSGNDGNAGAILAALFLRRFVGPSVKWAHIDIAGPCSIPETRGYRVAGATGYGARLLAEFIKFRSMKSD